jgi:hypothetical protein
MDETHDPVSGGDDDPGLDGGKPVAGSLREFRFTDKTIRTVIRDGEPWFVAVDVCKALDLANPSQAVKRLHVGDTTLIPTEGGLGGPGLNVVSEAGLYLLVMRSNKPQAEPFQRWVTNEVLPSIRRTGAYVRPVPERPWVPPPRAEQGMTWECTSRGPLVGSMLPGDVTATIEEFIHTRSHQYVTLPGGYSLDHPNDSNVLRWLDRRGRGDECARHPLTGGWVFRLGALQDWYREEGSFKPFGPR